MTEEIRQLIINDKLPTNPIEVMGGTKMYTCPICKKRFVVSMASSWAFKRVVSNGTYRFCSYKCFQEYKEVLGK